LDHKKNAFLGISFLSYGFISFVHFSSSFKLFQLEKGDKISFHFEDGEQIEFVFHSPKTTVGFINKNVHPIKDEELQKLENANLDFWKITNTDKKISMAGGFAYNDFNKQYKSQKTGQKLLRLMAKHILITKEQLNERSKI